MPGTAATRRRSTPSSPASGITVKFRRVRTPQHPTARNTSAPLVGSIGVAPMGTRTASGASNLSAGTARSSMCLDLGRSLLLRRDARVLPDELLGQLVGLVVDDLLRRRLHEVRAR